MSLEVQGVDAVIDFGEKLTNTMPVRYGTYLEKFALEVLDLARSNLQNNRSINTGTLLASLRILEIANEGLEITVGSMEDYAKYIEYGRGPVAPVTAHFLSWVDKTTGKRIFAKKAAPTEPMPFFEPAVIALSKRYPQIVVQNETEFIGGLFVG